MYYRTFSVGQEFERGLAGWIWLSISHEVTAWLLSTGAASSKPWRGLRLHFQDGALPWRLVGGLVPHHMDLSIGLFLTTPSKGERARGKPLRPLSASFKSDPLPVFIRNKSVSPAHIQEWGMGVFLKGRVWKNLWPLKNQHR